MKRNITYVAAGLVLIVLAAAAFLVFRPADRAGHAVARITLDGVLVEEIDLDALTQPRTLTVEGKSGLTNTIVAENGTIRVEKADCPDQICVHQGAISDGTVPIVCLPNRLIIEIIGGGESLDAAAG